MLQQNRPLTGQFSDYLTDVDESWERLPPGYQAHLDQNMPEWWETMDMETDDVLEALLGDKNE